MPTFKAALLGGFTALVSACSPSAAINFLVPKYGYDVHGGLSYGADPRQKLDIYVPHGLKGPAPVLLFFYGGSWESGKRGDYLAFGQAFASKGIITVVADYRLYPQVKIEGFVADSALAVSYLHAHAGAYGGDPNRIFIAGHSAGAYNAVMVASEPKYLAAEGGALSWIKGVIGIAGPYDFLPLTQADYIDMFHGAENKAAMPINHVDGPRPPMLLVTGAEDATVGPGNSDRMAARLRAFGNSAKVKHYPGTGHVGVILSLAPGFRGTTTLRQDVLDFIHAH